MTRWFDPNAPVAPDAPAPVQNIYRRIFAYMGEFRRGIGLSMGLAMLGSLLITLQPWPIKFIIDDVLIGNELNIWPFGEFVNETDGEKLTAAAGLAATYLAITVAGVLMNAGSFYVIARTALLMIHTLRSRIMGHLRTLSLRYHANQSIGDSIWKG